MTRFEDKSFSVPMPGNEAKQWPLCEHQCPLLPHLTCRKEFGHKGKHGDANTRLPVEWD